MTHLFYLHGFASSARSSKARFFAERLAPLGPPLHCPDFNDPDFSTLTTTRMLDQVDAAIAALPPGPVVLIGSSLGAFVAWHAAARQARAREAQAGEAVAAAHLGTSADTHPIVKLILLAPALDFGANRVREIGDEGLARWKATDRREFFHYGYNEPRTVHYALYEDARQYDSARAHVDTPALVFQGQHDTSVDPEHVRAFCAARPTMTLHLLDDDHQLLGSLDRIWTDIVAFVGLPGA